MGIFMKSQGAKFQSAMRTLPCILIVLLSAITCLGQGQLWFHNTPTTLITTSSVPGGPATGPISGAMGSYNFALLMAPAGTVDPSAFSYTGISTVNWGADGRFGGELATVPNTEVGDIRSFIIRG